MISFQHLLHRFSKPQTPTKVSAISHYVNLCITATTSCLPHDNTQQVFQSPPPESIHDPAKFIASLLSECANLHQLDQIYAHVLRTRLLDSYTAAFHWNNIIRAYTKLAAPNKALYVYIFMSRAGVLPDCYTLPVVLKAVCLLFDGQFTAQIHSVAIRVGIQSNEFCESGFISVYSKAGEFQNARKVFDENRERKLGSWNAIIAGLSQCGRSKEVIDMFMEMKRCGLEPDDVTMVSVTSACGSLGHLNLAIQLHKCVIQAKTVERSDLLMLNSLIDMYGKCGRMDLAYRVFSRMDQRNVSSWTSMIVGYAMHGHANEALECFHCMRESNVRPNHVTFVGVFSACVHGGKVKEGKHFFEVMKKVYRIEPRLAHFGCMVDLLGRAGQLEEAREVVEGMPMRANAVIWGCLMGACEKFGNMEMGEWVSKHLIELEPWNDGVYVVLSNIYASRGLWEEVARVRGIMKHRKLDKLPAYSLATSPD